MTDEELINLVRSEEYWEHLHQLCLEQATALQLASVLERMSAQMPYETAVWAGVLREIHPNIKLNLPKSAKGGAT